MDQNILSAYNCISNKYNMSRIESPRYSRIQQHIADSKADALYQPLRSTIMKNSYAQNGRVIGNDLHLDSGNSRLQISRVSRKMRSLSPQEAQKLKNNIYIPINKRLVPTRNYQRINGKQFQAIDCQQKFYRPIPQRQLKSNSNIKFGSIDKIVYQFQDQQNGQTYNQSSIGSYNNGPINFRSNSPANTQHIVQNRFKSPQVRVSSPVNNIYTSKNQMQNYQVPAYRRTQGNNKINSPSLMGSQVLYQNNNINKQRGLQANSDLRQFPSEHVISPLMSRTSFDAGINNIHGINTSKGYDFSKSNASSTQSLYKAKKKQAFKYNLFSILDEPGNTKCKSGCCAENQIIAKNPTIYQWAQ